MGFLRSALVGAMLKVQLHSVLKFTVSGLVCPLTQITAAFHLHPLSLSFSGDPVRDLEYEKQIQTPGYIIPEIIKNFLIHFQKCVSDGNLYEIQHAYENG